jgi:hypothetical protein
MQDCDGPRRHFALTEDGNVVLDHGDTEEMDFAAERLAREMMNEPQ